MYNCMYMYMYITGGMLHESLCTALIGALPLSLPGDPPQRGQLEAGDGALQCRPTPEACGVDDGRAQEGKSRLLWNDCPGRGEGERAMYMYVQCTCTCTCTYCKYDGHNLYNVLHEKASWGYSWQLSQHWLAAETVQERGERRLSANQQWNTLTHTCTLYITGARLPTLVAVAYM